MSLHKCVRAHRPHTYIQNLHHKLEALVSLYDQALEFFNLLSPTVGLVY